GLGGAVLADLDTSIVGSGVLTPQTDTSAASFGGNYVFGAQNFWGCSGVCEFDSVANGTVVDGGTSRTSGSVVNKNLSGIGLLSDPFFFWEVDPINSGVGFATDAVPDGVNAGRYVASPFATTVSGVEIDFNTVIYQASGDMLYWVDLDEGALSL